MFVARDNSSLEGEVEFVLTWQPGCYIVEVYDWEEDGSVGLIAIPVERRELEWSQPCITAVVTHPTKGTERRDSRSRVYLWVYNCIFSVNSWFKINISIPMTLINNPVSDNFISLCYYSHKLMREIVTGRIGN